MPPPWAYSVYPFTACRWVGYMYGDVCHSTEDWGCFFKNASLTSLNHMQNAFIGVVLVYFGTTKLRFWSAFGSTNWINTLLVGWEVAQELTFVLHEFGFFPYAFKDEWVPGDNIGDIITHVFGFACAILFILILEMDPLVRLKVRSGQIHLQESFWWRFAERTIVFMLLTAGGDRGWNIPGRENLPYLRTVFRQDLLWLLLTKGGVLFVVYIYDVLRARYSKTYIRMTNREWFWFAVMNAVMLLMFSWIWYFPYIMTWIYGSVLFLVLLAILSVKIIRQELRSRLQKMRTKESIYEY
jgi:hypothetical protein